MNATRVLVGQHRAIAPLFDEVAAEVRRAARVRALSQLAEELIAHLAGEDAVFYPAVRAVLRGDRLLADGLQLARVRLRAQLRRTLETAVDAASFGQELDALRSYFADHAAGEEEDLFPRAEAAMDPAGLAALGAEVDSSRPPVWVVTSERASLRARSRFGVRSRVSFPFPSRG